MLLYKYTRAIVGLAVLRTAEIRFSQLSSLNDPFESHLPVTDLLTDNSIAGLLDTIINNQDLVGMVIKNTVDKLYSEFAPNISQRVSKDDFETYLFQQVRDELARQGKSLHSILQEQMQAKMPEILAGVRAKLPDSVAGEIGALSLTAIPDNEVMWSHYADSHQGLLLGFNSDDPFFSNVFKIKYQNERPKLDLRQLSTELPVVKDRIQALFGIKNEAWAYEQEYRLIEAVKILRDTGMRDSRGMQIFVKQFSPTILNSVVLGSRLSQETQTEICSLLARPGFTHIKLFREIIDKLNCRIRIIDA